MNTMIREFRTTDFPAVFQLYLDPSAGLSKGNLVSRNLYQSAGFEVVDTLHSLMMDTEEGD